MLITIPSFALAFWASGAVTVCASGSTHPANLSQCFALSLGKMLASVPDGFAIKGNVVLLGLFGFVLGNYFRQT